MVAVFVFLSGICFSEEFGYLQESPEKTHQAAEQALSHPVDRPVYLSDEQAGVPASFMIPAIIELPETELLVDLVSLAQKYQPPPNTLKLFKLICTYRI